ncbi:hypothetical protein HYU95_00175, partial [Candidatus Daviesbacteria bacterium]|nr:hypothetical protein [Candidatus Daviesbacteria bacterium]
MKNIILFLLYPLLFITLIFDEKSADVEYIAAQKTPTQDNSVCTDRDIVSHMCNGGVSEANKAGCLEVKNGKCKEICKNSVASPPQNTILCQNNSTCTVTDFNSNPEHPGMGSVNLDLNWNIYSCTDAGVIPSGETLCYWTAEELCESTDDPSPADKQFFSRWPLIGSLNSRKGFKSIGPIWWIKPGFTYTYKLYQTGYTCTSEQNCTQNGEWSRRTCKGKEVASITVKTGTQSTPTPAPAVTPTPAATTLTPTPSPTLAGSTLGSTVSFRIAENPTDLNNAPWKDYTSHPVTVDFEFKDKNPGEKFVWVEFKGSDGRIISKNTKIKLLGDGPKITGCGVSFEGDNAVLSLRGDRNFGLEKGEVKSSDGKTLQIKEWGDSLVKAVWPNAPLGQVLSVTLTNTDSQKAEGQCSAISQLSLGAKVFCRAPSSHDADNVDLILLEDFEGSAKAKQKVKIDKSGVIQGLNQKLEAGKKYKLSLKAPRSIRRTVEFTAEEGNTNISNFILPVGDIFPLEGGDGKINSMDKAELNRQWIIAQAATGRSGDFNGDSRVNSIDWACMRYDFNSEDSPEPAISSSP